MSGNFGARANSVYQAFPPPAEANMYITSIGECTALLASGSKPATLKAASCSEEKVEVYMTREHTNA